ncbi:MAG: DUF882 domain-containing protein [Pseudomonadota bacterium]|nr:DUF882 domain-containing protein [Pseudomonadota bacterium]
MTRQDRTEISRINRRRFLMLTATAIGGATLTPGQLLAKTTRPERQIAIRNLHTGERLRETYWADGKHIHSALESINHVLRDFRTGDIHPIDAGLIDTLYLLSARLDATPEFEIISGYRSPHTNEMLRRSGGGVAKKSYHMRGMAVDVRMPKIPLRDVRQAALQIGAGGVGYYPKSGFIHLDTGPVRSW